MSSHLFSGILTEVWRFLEVLARLVNGAFGLSPEAFVLAASERALGAAYTIAFLAGVSEMIGQSVILVINRVPAWRFIASLLFTGLIYSIAAVTWALSVVAVTSLFRVGIIDAIGYAGLFAIIAMSYAPRLLGVFTIAPYFGVALGYLFDAWVMVCVIIGLRAAAELPLEAAAFCGLLGWAAAYGARALAAHYLRKPLGALRRAVSGSALEMTPRELLHRLASPEGENRTPPAPAMTSSSKDARG